MLVQTGCACRQFDNEVSRLLFWLKIVYNSKMRILMNLYMFVLTSAALASTSVSPSDLDFVLPDDPDYDPGGCSSLSEQSWLRDGAVGAARRNSIRTWSLEEGTGLTKDATDMPEPIDAHSMPHAALERLRELWKPAAVKRKSGVCTVYNFGI